MKLNQSLLCFRALGVTLWELFENATQPYPHLSDREVLNHVIKEQQVKLFKPQLELPYSDRWYEILQFCWLSPDRRATAEEVHRLLIYLRMQGQKDVEEDFEQRWDALKPNPSTRQTTVSHSSFPILDQFADDALRHEIDEVLTVTETSKGLSFEYVWEAAKHDHYDGHHACSGMDTTLNYHSMFFPISREDIQAHFPDPLGKPRGEEHSSGVTGILPVFDSQKSSNGNEYFVQLEEQGENTVEDGSRGQDLGCTSSRQDFVVLQDARLDESSTDADFFHQSIDSKDSYLPDSHIWSSLENDSPYHTNIFTEDGSKQDDSPSWRRNFMELPERNGNPFVESSMEEVHMEQSYGNPFLDEPLEEERMSTDDRNPLKAEELSGNFVFLRDHRLMKEDSVNSRLHPTFLLPGLVHEPEETFKMSSWENLETFGSLNTTDSYSKPAPMVADDNTSSYLPVLESSSSKDRSLPPSSDRGADSGFDSTSEKVEVITDGRSSAFSDSATTDSLCTYANIASLDDDDPTSLQTARKKTPEYVPIYGASTENGHGEDLTSNDLFSELIEDVELETTLSDHDESFMEANGESAVRSSLLVSGPSLDQISQDSLLEDSSSTTVPTAEHPAGTPDSLDSLDIHRLAEQAGELSAQTLHHKLHPPYKISDSGYETENLESPEWNSQPNDCSPIKNGSSITKEPEELASAANLVPPKIIISEVEGLLESCGEDFHEDPQTDRPVEEPLMGGSYRDSAYFSDNESEPEKKSEEAAGGSADAVLVRNSGGPAQEASKERDIDALFSEQDATAAAETILAELVSENDKNAPQLFNATSEEPEDPAASSTKEPERSLHPKLTRTYASDGHKIKEPDMEGRYLGRGEDLDGQEDGVDADEEDENSEDSDDDLRAYQLRSSSSDSEDEAPHPVPVIVSDDSNSKHLKSLLKPTTLSIPPSTSPFPARTNAENSRRAVSFFDDVTVYLFDQETPLKELSDHLSGPNSQTSEFNSPVPAGGFLNRFGNSESSTDEEGGGFEWDDDFTSSAPTFSSKTNKDSASKGVLPSAPMGGRMPEPSWTNTSAYSRFSISPASIASFSLTHLTDSDIEQGGKSVVS
ncbi:hypothetical protein OJAV_G00077970 [Oryzias javanicus]|uniref:Serine-threonine/tyrosine-protein kinase catalytic domain-containing protein n=1 Tax=Oryzias javanicus TaxID=123683 RepID=A0A437D473_ORYJA|nr:hypothetical protein OJAV_G00077970 [Oryzias javanicus]